MIFTAPAYWTVTKPLYAVCIGLLVMMHDGCCALTQRSITSMLQIYSLIYCFSQRSIPWIYAWCLFVCAICLWSRESKLFTCVIWDFCVIVSNVLNTINLCSVFLPDARAFDLRLSVFDCFSLVWTKTSYNRRHKTLLCFQSIFIKRNASVW